ncbi:undecaprenyldiphospho-muramoylpentapeptide beta-N-acetylglucosaminyltransferase [Microvirga tunisiensis]|uniref:Undecaprenyldiphospho-muramoylpentapeptide beta-N-acetylglucosaminyltransferase n=2 Tax=Pannonibacter tanglangensis TaxID=2750084 RepID=A0ABW9ZEV6_9HYPH|nr:MULTISPECIES: undecaprenyldiphospho-muramoylpentapeptide beta-N-acetylglucosaminyltransferase [unclassified Pannonibacter]NBN63372.1 undecaprenyldiphospho-muramoylpentapeptide beta-N-acetylglucosaminyltransferase [Pannonibacter sp. XCT-34]NBN77007.1 undecaprenyldiphospho-muramoylpentapeptide beta-N-acetylglucosaminyltransferase [Pannonibacter sp. XCT-53]
MTKTILLTAGGTGGHLFPAEALATELVRRGWTVDLATDERADKYGARFPARDVHIIASETLRSRSPLALLRTLLSLARGTLQAFGVIRRIRPAVVVGFGGYPTFPPMMAARLARVPSILHEANAVMGRANRMLARGVDAVATSVPIAGLDAGLAAKVRETGNPVRPMVIEAARLAYPPLDGAGPFHLLVFGGSQGARFFSELMPEALALMPADKRARLRLVQQCRPEDLDRVRKQLETLGVHAELAAFFTDLPMRLAGAHLILCRSGASSVSELAVIGRPSILVPLPHALDQDQSANARVLEAVGGAWPIDQKNLTPQALADRLGSLMDDPETLAAAARAAAGQGKADAVARLADLVEQVAAQSKT